MKYNAIRVCQWLLLPAAAISLFARSAGPPTGRTGAPADGGLDCTVCHRSFPVNSGPGRLTIGAVPYRPGEKQTITITIEDPDGQRWGFQLTARLKSDENVTAGTFLPGDFVQVRCDPDGRNGPCEGAKEFASHNLVGTRPGTPSPGVFTMEWIPPAEDAGDVVFYAAGNAADNSGTNTGDHIYTTSLTIPSGVCNLTDKPTVTRVNSAPGTSVISTNALISIYGGPFAASGAKYEVTSSDLREGKLPSDEFRCVSVEVAGKRAPILSVQTDQINAQAPILDINGSVDVRVTLNPGTPKEIRSDPARAQSVIYGPALFTFEGRSVIPPDVVARAGETVTVSGTGFQVSEPVFQPGEFPWLDAPVRDPYTITVGGIAVPRSDIMFGGLSRDIPGLYLFTFRLPASLPAGNAPIVMRIGGAQTQDGLFIPVSR